MGIMKIAALAGALAATAAVMPVAEAQTATPAPQPRVEPRVVVAPRAQAASGWAEIGVSVRDAEAQDVKGGAGGVLVTDVVKDGPAEKAGVKSGDVFTEFDGERVRSARQFTRLVQETAVGRKVTAAVLRDGQKVTLTIEPRARGMYRLLGDWDDGRWSERIEELRDMIPPPPPPAPPAPKTPPTPGAPPVPPAPPAPPRAPEFEIFWRGANALGVTTQELSSQLGDYFGVKDGVLVTSVSAESAAAKAGLKAGDVITTFNGTTIGSPSELRRAIQRLDDGTEFTIGVMRERKSVTLKGKMEPRRRHTWTFRSDV